MMYNGIWNANNYGRKIEVYKVKVQLLNKINIIQVWENCGRETPTGMSPHRAPKIRFYEIYEKRKIVKNEVIKRSVEDIMNNLPLYKMTS